MTDEQSLRRLSLWWETLPDELVTADRPALDRTETADVVIIGGGYTGLWTAYYLAMHDPNLRVVVLEAEVAGFGASGRNGGWCSSHFPPSLEKMAASSTRDAAIAMQKAMHATVHEVGDVANREGIDCEWKLGGGVTLARTPLQLEHAQADVAHMKSWGFDEYPLLSADEARARVGATNVLGGVYEPYIAAINPAKLVRGLALAAERRGVVIHENSRVTSFGPGVARTANGEVRARYVVRATEGYTAQLPGQSRTLVPVYSLMLATEPLPEEFWNEVGLANRETFTDFRHVIIYGQRTADNRFAFGGRGAQYHLNSNIDPRQERNDEIHRDIWARLVDLFPAVADFRVTHTWGGPLGIPRDWFSSVGLDTSTGMGWSGGYVGDGVGTANLGGRTLADLILGRDSELTRLPWVNHRSPKWEPEPLRWAGVRTGNFVMASADRIENRKGKDSIRARAFKSLIGG